MIDSYRTLPLGKYVEILAIDKEEGIEELEKQIKILSILSGISEDEIGHLPIVEYKEMVSASSFLKEPNIASTQVADKYLYGGYELIPVKDYRKVETCQYVDFQTFAADVDKYLVEYISVILVPKGKRYNEGYDILEVQKALREEMPVAEAVALTAFFLTMCRGLILDSLNFCNQSLKEVKDKEKRMEMERKINYLQSLLT